LPFFFLPLLFFRQLCLAMLLLRDMSKIIVYLGNIYDIIFSIEEPSPYHSSMDIALRLVIGNCCLHRKYVGNVFLHEFFFWPPP
jgi:hypothetical protein